MKTTTPDMVTIRVHYPMEGGRIALRTEADWDANVEATDVSDEGNSYTFTVPVNGTYLYFKPLLIRKASEHWAIGDNYLVLGGSVQAREIYPHFIDSGGCTVCDLLELDPALGGSNQFRVLRPPGYNENVLKRYPVLYMQDGQNLFFPTEAFGGKHWRVAETLSLLDIMNIVNKVIVVGIYPDEREHDYTAPGYAEYGRFVVDRLKPSADLNYRTLTGPEHTGVMGSSLGGVVSFYLAWEHSDVFGMAGCMSSTFGWRDDLLERVADEPRRPLRIYLDSGWPSDNFEVTRNMATLLQGRGYYQGRDLLYLSFPEALHNEQFWSMRSHIPYQFFFGK